MTGASAGVDQVDDRFSLRQVNAPVEESAFGKLSRRRHPHSLCQHSLQDALRCHHTAVATDLCHVLARIRPWTPHNAQEGFIDTLALGIYDKPVVQAMGIQTCERQPMRSHTDTLRHGDSLWTAEAHDP